MTPREQVDPPCMGVRAGHLVCVEVISMRAAGPSPTQRWVPNHQWGSYWSGLIHAYTREESSSVMRKAPQGQLGPSPPKGEGQTACELRILTGQLNLSLMLR